MCVGRWRGPDSMKALGVANWGAGHIYAAGWTEGIWLHLIDMLRVKAILDRRTDENGMVYGMKKISKMRPFCNYLRLLNLIMSNNVIYY